MNLNTEDKLAFTTDDAWTLLVGDVDLIETLKWLKGYDDGRQVWEAIIPLFGTGWLRLRAMAEPGSSLVVFWAWFVAGDTGISEPRLPRREVRIVSNKAPIVDYTICDDSPLVPDPKNLGFTKGGLLHGQGITLRSFHVDFGQNIWGGDDAVFAPNSYMPRDPNQTGGNWDYMGLSYPVASIKITDVYAIGGYGGFFQHGSNGKLVAEVDMPDLQADSHIHEHSKDPGWIDYTSPRNPWMDRMSVFRVNADGQHLSQISVLAQVAEFYPKDEGLKMLLEAWSHVYTRQFPAVARGTTHHKSGQERGQGRITKSGTDAYMALREDDRESADRFGIRAIQRWEIDVDAFVKRYPTGLGFATFASTGAYSTNEIGIHYWGLWRLHRAIESLGARDIGEVHFWMAEASRWCFESFRFYDIQGDRHWGYPYFEDKNHLDLSGPVSAEHFGWLAATHFEPRNPTERAKHEAIVALGAGMDERFTR